MILYNYRNIFNSSVLCGLLLLLFLIVGCSPRKAGESKPEKAAVENAEDVEEDDEASEDLSSPSSLKGRSMEDVKSLLGKPRGRVTKEGKIVWLYEECMIIFEDGKEGKRVSSVVMSDH